MLLSFCSGPHCILCIYIAVVQMNWQSTLYGCLDVWCRTHVTHRQRMRREHIRSDEINWIFHWLFGIRFQIHRKKENINTCARGEALLTVLTVNINRFNIVSAMPGCSRGCCDCRNIEWISISLCSRIVNRTIDWYRIAGILFPFSVFDNVWLITASLPLSHSRLDAQFYLLFVCFKWRVTGEELTAQTRHVPSAITANRSNALHDSDNNLNYNIAYNRLIGLTFVYARNWMAALLAM